MTLTTPDTLYASECTYRRRQPGAQTGFIDRLAIARIVTCSSSGGSGQSVQARAVTDEQSNHCHVVERIASASRRASSERRIEHVAPAGTNTSCYSLSPREGYARSCISPAYPSTEGYSRRQSPGYETTRGLLGADRPADLTGPTTKRNTTETPTEVQAGGRLASRGPI